MRSRNFLVPIFKDSGKLSTHLYWHGTDKDIKEWAPNFEAELELRLMRIRPTRGGFRAVFVDIQGHEYYMMGADFNELLRDAEPIHVNELFSAAHKSYDFTIRKVNREKDEPLDMPKMIRLLEAKEENV